MAGQLTCRPYSETDVPDILRLWDEAGWGEISLDLWRQRYVSTPDGDALIVVAAEADSGTIVGQSSFIPARVSIDGREVRAVRPSVVIMSKASRGLFLSADPLDHPVSAMYRRGLDAAWARGVRLAYMTPDSNWLPFLRLLPALRCGGLPIWRLPLPLASPLQLGAGYRAGPVGLEDPRVDGLWKAARRLHGCMVVRDSRALRRKTADHRVLGVERGSELVGLVASQLRVGWPGLLVGDLLAADGAESLRATLVAVTNLAHSRAIAEDRPTHTERLAIAATALRVDNLAIARAALVRPPRITEVTIAATPLMEPVLRDLGFAPAGYELPLVIHAFDATIPGEALEPARWYESL